MRKDVSKTGFVTERRIEMAKSYADEVARENPDYTAAQCAEKAVRKIFGRWLLDHTAAVRPELIPQYFQLVSAVETRLGVHRRLRHRARPVPPALRAALPWVGALDAGEFVGTSAIAI